VPTAFRGADGVPRHPGAVGDVLLAEFGVDAVQADPLAQGADELPFL
jgi:hypothetical protein